MAVTKDGVRASRPSQGDMIAECRTCFAVVEEQGEDGRRRATSWARRHVAKTGHVVGLVKSTLVVYRPETKP